MGYRQTQINKDLIKSVKSVSRKKGFEVAIKEIFNL